MTERHDAIIVGGGIMGCMVAHGLAVAGQRVALFERGGLCAQASGVNAGTLSLQIKRTALIPYAMGGLDLWRTAREWLGNDLGYRTVGGLTLAFTDEEAQMLSERMTARREKGAPIEMVGPNRARELEPGLSDKPLLASWCPVDGYAGSYLLGEAMRHALGQAGVAVHEHTPVESIEPGDGATRVLTPSGTHMARRIVIAGGVWLEGLLARYYGVRIPVTCRVNQVAATERMKPAFSRIIGVATGQLTLKTAANGTVLIGGGWQGRGDPETGAREIIPDNLIGNLRLALHAVPALRQSRLVRAWLGLEGVTSDAMPLAGPVPGHPDAYVIGCVKGGFTIGPYLAKLLVQTMLDQLPEMPLFDPARLVEPSASAAAQPS